MTIYLLKFFLFISTLDKVLLGFQEMNLVVVDSISQEENPAHLLKFLNDSLVLGCYLKNNSEDNDINLKWIYYRSTFDAIDDDFSNESSIAKPYDIVNENGTLKLHISNLQHVHNGKYKCEARINDSEVYNQNVTLIVKSKPSCDKKFDCDGNQCISSIFKCDGVVDCKTKSDESPEICGPNPCEGRIKCSNGRCIPEEWCEPCDPQKINCTNRYTHDCCPNQVIINFPKGLIYGDGSYPGRYNDYDRLNMQQHYDINFIQTTIYTIIGCALVFMIIGTVLVVAICRIHMKRSPLTHVPNNRRSYTTTAYHRAFTQEIGVYDLDISSVNRPEGPGLLVTYNINNGVQIVGSPVEPPPYSEIASLPPREGPPPPYTLSNLYDNTQNLLNVRSAQCETSPKSNNNRPVRHGLSNCRVSSEPSLLNVNRL